jgi:hypothetical protein
MQQKIIRTCGVSLEAVARYVVSNMLGVAVGLTALCAVGAFVLSVVGWFNK